MTELSCTKIIIVASSEVQDHLPKAIDPTGRFEHTPLIFQYQNTYVNLASTQRMEVIQIWL